MPFDFLKPKPKQSVTRYPTDFLLGDLLVRAGLVSQQQLDEAVKLAGSKNVHVGQMLINFRYISPRDLQAAVDAQSMLRDRTIDHNLAAGCLKIACKTGMTFAEVVRDQHAGSSEGLSNKLGELLSESGLVTKEQLAKSMQRSQATGLPLGRILVLNGALSDPILTMALEIQVRIRDGMMTRDEALEALSAAGGTEGAEPKSEETMRMTILQPRKKGIRLGELMVLAGLLNETDVMNALELGLVNNQQIGQVLVEQGYVSEELLNAALELQKRVDEDKLMPQDAGEALAKIKSTGQDVSQVLENIDKQVAEAETKQIVSFDKMLMLARVVTQDDIDNALEKSAKNSQLLAKVLHMTGYIDELTMQCVLQCYTMMSNGFLTQDDAIVTLDYCLNREEKISFAEALSHIGWNATLPMQVHGATSVDISQVKLGLFGTKVDSVETERKPEFNAFAMPSKAELDAIAAPSVSKPLTETELEDAVVAASALELGAEEPRAEARETSSPLSAPPEPPPMLASLLDDMLQQFDESSAEDQVAVDNFVAEEFVAEEFVAEEFVFEEPARDDAIQIEQSEEPEDIVAESQDEEQPSLLDSLLDGLNEAADDDVLELAVMTAKDKDAASLILEHEPDVVEEELSSAEAEPASHVELRSAEPSAEEKPVHVEEVPSMLGNLLDEISDEIDLKASLEEAAASKERTSEPMPLESLSLNSETARDLERKRELDEAAHSHHGDFESKGSLGPMLLKDDYEPFNSELASEVAEAKLTPEPIAEFTEEYKEEPKEELTEESVADSTASYDNLPAFFKVLIDQEEKVKTSEPVQASNEVEVSAAETEEVSASVPAVDEVRSALSNVLGGDETEAAEVVPEPVAKQEYPANENKLVSLSELRGLFSSERGTNGGGKGAVKPTPAPLEPAPLLEKLLSRESDLDAGKESAASAAVEEVADATAPEESLSEVASSEVAVSDLTTDAAAAADLTTDTVTQTHEVEVPENQLDLAASMAPPVMPEDDRSSQGKEVKPARESKNYLEKQFDLRAVMEEFEAASTLFDSHEKLTDVPDNSDDYERDDDVIESPVSAATEHRQVDNLDETDSMKQLLQGAAAAKAKIENEPLSMAAPDSVVISGSEEGRDALPEVSASSDDSNDAYSSVLKDIIGTEREAKELPLEISEIDDLFNADTEKKAAEALHVVEFETPKLVSAQELLSQLEESIASIPPEIQKVEPRSEAESIALRLIEELAESVKAEEIASTTEPAVAEVPPSEKSERDPLDAIEPYSFARTESAATEKAEPKTESVNAAPEPAIISVSDEEHEDVDSLFSRAKPAYQPEPEAKPALAAVAETAPIEESKTVPSVEPIAASTSQSPFQSMILSTVGKSATESPMSTSGSSSAAGSTAAVPAVVVPISEPVAESIVTPPVVEATLAETSQDIYKAPVVEAPSAIPLVVEAPIATPVAKTSDLEAPSVEISEAKPPVVETQLAEVHDTPVVASAPISDTPVADSPVVETQIAKQPVVEASVVKEPEPIVAPALEALKPQAPEPAPLTLPVLKPATPQESVPLQAAAEIVAPLAVPPVIAPAMPAAVAPAMPVAAVDLPSSTAGKAAIEVVAPQSVSTPAPVKAAAAPSFWAEALSKANVVEEAAPPVEPAPNPAVLQSVIIAQLEAQVLQAEGAAVSEGEKGVVVGAKNDLKSALGEALARLAESYYEQGDYTQAQGLYERILLLKQNQLGSKHEALGADLTNLAGVLCVQGKFAEAEPYVKRIATIIEASEPVDTLRLAGCLNTLASVLFQQGKFPECEPLLEKSLKLRQEKLGPDHADIADTLRDYAKLLRKLGRNADAELMYAQAKAILAKRPRQNAPAAAPAPTP